MFRISNENKRKMVTNNGVRYIRRKSRLSSLMLIFGLILSMTLFFGYSKFILAQDDFDFNDDLWDDDGDFGTSNNTVDTGASFGGTSDPGSGEKEDFDLSDADIAKFEISADIKTKYFNDDPSDDKEHKDPFKPLIIRITKVRIPITVVDGQEMKPQTIPPLNLKLVGVIQAGDRKLSMITLDDQFLELFEGDEDPNGKFKVMKIENDSVQVVSYQHHGERRTLTMDGGN